MAPILIWNNIIDDKKSMIKDKEPTVTKTTNDDNTQNVKLFRGRLF